MSYGNNSYNAYYNSSNRAANLSRPSRHYKWTELPEWLQGCVIYWFMMMTGVLALFRALMSDDDPDKRTRVTYSVMHLAIVHIYFGYMCHLKTQRNTFANTIVWGGITLVLWYVIWGVVIPKFGGVMLPQKGWKSSCGSS